MDQTRKRIEEDGSYKRSNVIVCEHVSAQMTTPKVLPATALYVTRIGPLEKESIRTGWLMIKYEPLQYGNGYAVSVSIEF
jgi:hypothetical protein